MLKYLIKSYQIKSPIFNRLYPVFNPAIRFRVRPTKTLKERPVDLFREIVYKRQHGKT
jgi:hypothetical protein